jgi:CRISP-associated protein Cas1
MMLEDVADIVNLQRAWAVVLANDEADGKLGFAVRTFAEDAHVHLPALTADLIAMSYEPAPLRALIITEADGDERELHLSAVRDRIVERAVAQVLSPVVDPMLSPFSFAFRRGLGVRDAIDKLIQARDAGLTMGVRSDLAKCFDRIDHGRLVEKLAQLRIHRDLLRLIEQLIEREVLSEGIGYPVLRGVPQGVLSRRCFAICISISSIVPSQLRGLN